MKSQSEFVELVNLDFGKYKNVSHYGFNAVCKGKTPMRVELQIRTNGMDFWATLEHQLRYKKGIEEMPGYDEISEELLHSARAIIEADNEMQRIKDKIGMFHEI